MSSEWITRKLSKYRIEFISQSQIKILLTFLQIPQIATNIITVMQINKQHQFRVQEIMFLIVQLVDVKLERPVVIVQQYFVATTVISSFHIHQIERCIGIVPVH